MTHFVALLRGVNVGGAKRVPMAEFRALLAILGYAKVRTLMNSGNAAFESNARSTRIHATRIREAIAGRLGLDVPVIVKSARDVTANDPELGYGSEDLRPSTRECRLTHSSARHRPANQRTCLTSNFRHHDRNCACE